MATMTIRGTYALDPETVGRLEALARRWEVSKSEALRRAIRAAAEAEQAPDTAVALLDELQRTAGLDQRSADEWVAEVQKERRRASTRRVGGR
ncbi:MAG: hypothetical protein CL441_05835 [Acidimicrobiaceae bacterium]|nr:hypothetical protein [Acidimicrobiaceae bacterium]